MKRIALSKEMKAKDTKTGLHGISSALKLVSQAISSMLAMNVQEAFICRILILTKLILAAAVKPAYSSFIFVTGVHGTSGLSFQIGRRRSSVDTSSIPFFFRATLFFSKLSMEIVFPSTPTLLPFSMFS